MSLIKPISIVCGGTVIFVDLENRLTY